MDLVLNNQQSLICHKTQAPNQLILSLLCEITVSGSLCLSCNTISILRCVYFKERLVSRRFWSKLYKPRVSSAKKMDSRIHTYCRFYSLFCFIQVVLGVRRFSLSTWMQVSFFSLSVYQQLTLSWIDIIPGDLQLHTTVNSNPHCSVQLLWIHYKLRHLEKITSPTRTSQN